MRRIDCISLTALILYAVLCYILTFMSYAEIGDSGAFHTILLLLYPAVLLYTIIWYIILLTKKHVSLRFKAGFLLFVITIPIIFVKPPTNPAFLGMRYLNAKLGGNARLIAWADKIFQMPLSDVTEEDYTQEGVLNIKDSLLKEVFTGDYPRPASMLLIDGKKAIQVFYGGGGVILGDKDYIKEHYSLVLYEVDGLFLWWLPK